MCVCVCVHLLFRSFDVRVQDLITKLLNPETTKRLGCLRNGAEDIKNHRWFKGMDWQAVLGRKVPTPHRPRVRGPEDTSNFDHYPDSVDKPLAPLTAEQRELFAEFDRL